jgi:hypothetical protein
MVALLNSSEDVLARLQQALEEGGFRTVAAHIADVQLGVLDLIAWMSETGADVILVDLPRPDGRALISSGSCNMSTCSSGAGGSTRLSTRTHWRRC